MLRSLSRLAIASAWLLSSEVAVAQDDQAFGPPVSVVTLEIPANGALLIADNTDPLDDADGPEVMPLQHVVVTGPSGEAVEGSLEHVTWYYWAWRPAAELEPGEHLIESTVGPPFNARDGVLSTTFEVMAALDLGAPALQAAPTISLSGLPEPGACCELWTANGVEAGHCTYSTMNFASLDPMLSSDASPAALDQFLFTVGPAGFMPDDAYYSWGNTSTISFFTQAEEYCFDVHAISIVDLSTHLLEGFERCAPHGDLESLGVVLTSTDPATFFDRELCTVPPGRFAAEWCEHNADCEAAEDADCVAFDHVCNDGPAVHWMPAQDDAGTPSDAGTQNDAGEHLPPDEAPEASDTAGGCSCRVQSARREPDALLILGLAMLSLRFALRRTRC